MEGYVPYEMVKDLIDLYEQRSKFYDFSTIYKDLTYEIEVQKLLIEKISHTKGGK